MGGARKTGTLYIWICYRAYVHVSERAQKLCASTGIVGHFLPSFLSLVTAPGLNMQTRLFMRWQALLNREWFYLSWTEQAVLLIVGILTEEPAWALTSGCHSVQGSILP